MVHTDSYLYLSRHNIYYFRAIVPAGVREDLHKREYRRSMQTRSLRVARNMARVLRISFDGHLEGMRASMTSWEGLRKTLDDRLDQLIMLERDKLHNTGPYPVTADDIWKSDIIPNYRQAITDISLSRVDSLSSGCIPDFVRNFAEKILQESNLDLDRESDLFTKFCEATARMYLKFTEERIILNDEARSFQPVSRPASPALISHAPPSPKISEVVDTYCREMVAGGNWSAKTESEYRGGYQTLITIIHDMPAALVDYPMAQAFKGTLTRLPSNMSKKPLYRNRPIKDILAMSIPTAELLSISKINTLLSRISSLFGWALKNGYTQVNPFSGLKIKEKVAEQDKRDPFILSDLTALFTAPDYLTGKHNHPYQYWLPLLGLFTGARIDELCQLHLEDIYQINGLWVFDINSKGDKKLKNLSSARVIPINTRLIALGLIEYVSHLRKDAQVRLFPELKKRRDGYSQDASKWFLRYRTRCGVTDKLKPFHSFRHTVANDLKQREVSREIIAAIVGHKDESITTGLYGKRYEPATLVAAIESLDFPVAVPIFKV